jgi:hypothetical protein
MTTRIDDPRVQIAVEPPSVPGAPGHDTLQAIGSGEGRPPMSTLAATPWLIQEDQERGCRIGTVGLRVYAAHPELELLNLPTMFLEPGIKLLKELAGYVLAGGRLEDEDVMQMRDALPCLVGFREMPGQDGGDPVVRVVLLA